MCIACDVTCREKETKCFIINIPDVHVAFDGDQDIMIPLNGNAPELHLYIIMQ